MKTKMVINPDIINEYMKNSENYPDEMKAPEFFHDELIANTYCRMIIRDLQKFKITPAIAAHVARLYFMFRNDYAMSLIIINRKNKIKEIIDIAYSHRAKLDKYIDKIVYVTKCAKATKCIVIINYNHRISSYKELLEMEKLYFELKNHGIVLCDVIKILRGRPTFLLSSFEKSGYPVIK